MSKAKVSDAVSSSPEASGGSPGTILRRCREFHGITLEEASETTKIGVFYLKALEDDQISKFANQAYLKGFLRIYAAYLGLNSDDIARMYDKLFGILDEKSDSGHAPAISPRRPRRFISLKKLLLPALLLTAILITATFFREPPPPLVRQPQPAAVPNPPRQLPAIQAVQSSVRAKKTEPDIPPPLPKAEKPPVELPDVEKTVKSTPPVVVSKGFVLKIKVTQNGTLTSTVDGSGPQEYDLTVGDVIEWKAEKNITLDLSNAGGVDVELNGKPYKSLGPPGQPAYVELDADGIIQ
ncbi:MAG: DUF4115 domain-containing protein [Desulfuromonadaceae bacterium]|nr:DUF4115 domain-containing protein [Desulfuromonadaceae bacterium]